jgi:type 1 fimbriae regulatory protein FimB/type 1 fimbriae regulatory protein FimE
MLSKQNVSNLPGGPHLWRFATQLSERGFRAIRRPSANHRKPESSPAPGERLVPQPGSLSDKEVAALMAAAAGVGRHGARDAALILIAYRHGLRVSELVSLRWDQVDLHQGLLHVTRRKHGIASVHPLRGPELRVLRRLQRAYPDTAYVFVSERKAPLCADAVRKIVGRAGREAGIEFPVHPHMLRHATGYKLANDGQDTRAIQHYLGHRNIQHTTRYTELAADRFKDFWRD